MSFFIEYDAITGKVLGRHDSDIHAPPEDAVVLQVSSKEEMLATMTPGWEVKNNQLVPPPEKPEFILLDEIDKKIGELRVYVHLKIAGGCCVHLKDTPYIVQMTDKDQLNNSEGLMVIQQDSENWTWPVNTTQGVCEVSVDELKTIVSACANFKTTLRRHYYVTKELLQSCTTKEKLDNVQTEYIG